MKFCVSTDVETWTNWSTFELDPNHSPDAGTEISESRKSVESRSNRHLTQSRLHITGCTAERYCLLHIVVQGPSSFTDLVNVSVRRTVAELRGVKLAKFSDFGLFSPYKTPKTYLPVTSYSPRVTSQNDYDFFHVVVDSPKGCIPAAKFTSDFW